MSRPGRARTCASVAVGSADAVAAALAACAGADVVELRLDALPEAALTPARLREWARAAPAPCIATCRPAWQQGGFAGEEDARRAILEGALDAGARWIDVELDAVWAADVLDGRRDRVVLSHHWEHARPDDLPARLRRLLDSRPAVGKLVAPAEHPADAVPLLAAGRRLAAAGIVPACFAMGERGRASRLLAGLDAGLVYVRAGPAEGTAPGQWRLAELRDDLLVARWHPDFARYGLLGDPIEHSLSPAIFNAAFVAAGREACYVPLPGRPFAQVLALAEAAGLRGLSVTMPYKEAAARACGRRSSLAERTGAANTLVRTADGWEGHNTDGQAVVEAMAAEVAVAGSRVVLVGAGGAARAAAFALRDAGAELIVLNRTVERARELAEAVGAAGWGGPEQLVTTSCDALVNATPVGMKGTVGTPVSTAGLRGGEVVMEMVYRPQQTTLLREAAERGCRVIPGVEMFLRQARAQHQLWFGEPPPAGVMREAAASRL